MPKILPNQTDLYALTDSRLSLGRPLKYVAESLLGAGIKILQYREKKLPAGKMLEECHMLRELTNEYGACFIVNDHIDIAMLAGADGVHIGQDDLPVDEVRKLVGEDMIIGLSTHSPAQARRAIELGADYIGVGPIFATRTKEDVVDPVGLEYLDYVSREINIPYVAIGGIKAHNIREVAKHGGYCAALVSELVGAEDIGGKAMELRELLRTV